MAAAWNIFFFDLEALRQASNLKPYLDLWITRVILWITTAVTFISNIQNIFYLGLTNSLYACSLLTATYRP